MRFEQQMLGERTDEHRPARCSDCQQRLVLLGGNARRRRGLFAEMQEATQFVADA